MVDESCAICSTTSDSLGRPLLRCGRCSIVLYCVRGLSEYAAERAQGAPCQRRDWPTHKAVCRQKLIAVVRLADRVQPGEDPSMTHLVPLYHALKRQSRIIDVLTTSELAPALAQKPCAVVLFDPEILQPPEPYSDEDDEEEDDGPPDPLLGVPAGEMLARYAREGGRVVCGGDFAGWLRPTGIEVLGQVMGYPAWARASYHRSVATLWPEMKAKFAHPEALAPSFSMKALALSGVDPAHVVYDEALGTRTTSTIPWMDGQPTSTTEARAVCAPVGRGVLCYVGDVNAELASSALILAMAGLKPDPVFAQA